MTLAGDLNTFYISNILQLLSEENKTGILQISDGKRRIEIVLEEGFIIYALGAKLEYRLGAILTAENLITTEQLEEALTEGKNKNLALGNILVQKGFISNTILEEHLQKQVEEIIYDVFLWESGEFEYEDTAINLERVIVTKLDVTRVLLEASRRIDEMAVFKKLIPSEDSTFRITERLDIKDKIHPTSNEDKILSLIDSRKSVKQLIANYDVDRLTLYKTLYSFISTGMIEPCEPHPTDHSLYSSLIKGYYDILQIIFKNIERQIGENAKTIFIQNKPIIEPEEKNVICHFNHERPLSENTDLILTEMKNYNNIEEGFNVLSDAFNMYILNILSIIPDIIGIEQTQNLLKDIQLIMSYISRIQHVSDEKLKIVSDVEYIIQKIKQRLNN